MIAPRQGTNGKLKPSPKATEKAKETLKKPKRENAEQPKKEDADDEEQADILTDREIFNSMLRRYAEGEQTEATEAQVIPVISPRHNENKAAMLTARWKLHPTAADVPS